LGHAGLEPPAATRICRGALKAAFNAADALKKIRQFFQCSRRFEEFIQSGKR